MHITSELTARHSRPPNAAITLRVMSLDLERSMDEPGFATSDILAMRCPKEPFLFAVRRLYALPPAQRAARERPFVLANVPGQFRMSSWSLLPFLVVTFVNAISLRTRQALLLSRRSAGGD